jgi:hypothetical protein
MAPLFPVLLAVHVSLAIALFIPALVLPFTLRTRTPAPPGRIARGALWLQAHGTVVIGAGLAATGIGMLVVLGPSFLRQPWLLVALATYAAVAALVYFVQRPGLRSLLGRGPAASDAERATWRESAKRQRYLAYAVTTGVGLIAFLMSTKPELW